MASLKHLFRLTPFVVLCFFSILISNPTRCLGAEPAARLYTFGDSLFDTGNGMVKNPNSPAAKYPYGMSNNKFMGRYSDGLALPDYIALFANLSLLPPSMKSGANFDQGANFAYPAASAFDGAAGSMNLKGQIDSFMRLKGELSKKVGETEKRAVLKKSVFVLCFGGVNYFSWRGSNPNSNRAQKIAFVNTVIDKLTTALYDIYLEGGRKFAFQNVMPLGCTPGNRVNKQQCQPHLTELANIHNAALLEANKRLKIELPGFSYSILDYYTGLSDRLNNPTQYGFKVGGTQACCGQGGNRANHCGTNPYDLCKDPNEYVFWDGAHMTQNANNQLATLFWSGGPEIVSGINLQHLFQLSPDESDPSTNLVLPSQDE